MHNSSMNKIMPEKAIKRLHRIIVELIPHIEKSCTIENKAADNELSKWFRNKKELGSRDRRLISTAVFQYFRWYGWTRIKLNVSFDQALLLSAKLEEDESSQWSAYLAGITNSNIMLSMGAMSISEKLNEINKIFKTTLTLLDLVPPSTCQHISKEIILLCMESFQRRPPPWLRLRSDNKDFRKILLNENIKQSLNNFLPHAMSIKSGINLNIALNKHQGKFGIQDLSSQCVGLICAPSEGDSWWDCCAGSGGKTFHLADIMKQEGFILASDSRQNSLNELKKKSRVYGTKIIRTKMINMMSPHSNTKDFDGVLVDAPCSGWGTWGRNPDARWRPSSINISACTKTQMILIKNAAEAVKLNGVLVYAVCTITQQETTDVINKFLESHQNFSLDPFMNPLDQELTSGMHQILPTTIHNGMFISRMKRIT